MKKLNIIIGVFMLITVLLPLTAHEKNCSCFTFQKEDKIYLNENYIFFDQGKIYLDMDDGYIQLNALRSDQQGIYFSVKEQKWPLTPFTCARYGRANPPWNVVCGSCGEPRPD